MTLFDSTQDFINDLKDLPHLPTDQRGEWHHLVRSRWIEGVSLDDERENPMSNVYLQRAANNQDGYEDILLGYEVGFQFGQGWDDLHQLSMDPRSAISLGQHLIEAGAAAMRDLGRHAFFKTGSINEAAEEVPKNDHL